MLPDFTGGAKAKKTKKADVGRPKTQKQLRPNLVNAKKLLKNCFYLFPGLADFRFCRFFCRTSKWSAD
jgi:hypothetical protein